MKDKFQSFVDGMTLGGGSIEHPLSIHSASIGRRWKAGGREGKRGTIIPRSKQRQASRFHAKKQTKRGKTAN